MTIYKDHLSTQSLSFSSEGYRAERTFLIDNVTGTAENKLYSATLMDGIPKYGDPHPVLPGAIATKIYATPEQSGDVVRITISYSVPNPDENAIVGEDEATQGELQINTSLTSEETFFDINGNFLIVEWAGVLEQGLSVTRAYNSANVQRPQVSITLKRAEAVAPKQAIANFLGKLNSTPWSGFPAKTWLCSGISAAQDKTQYNVDYSFSYKEAGWRVEIVQHLTPAQLNALPPDVETANGYGVFDVYATADFNQLGLSF